MREEDISTGSEGPGTDQCDREDSSDVYVDPAVEGDFESFTDDMVNT